MKASACMLVARVVPDCAAGAAKVRAIFRRHGGQPVQILIRPFNPALRGWLCGDQRARRTFASQRVTSDPMHGQVASAALAVNPLSMAGR